MFHLFWYGRVLVELIDLLEGINAVIDDSFPLGLHSSVNVGCNRGDEFIN